MGARGPLRKREGRQRRDNLPAVVAYEDAEVEIPPAPRGLRWSSRQLWRRFWGSVVAQAVEVNADRGAIRRWIEFVDERDRLREKLNDNETIVGAHGQDVLNPLYRRLRSVEGSIQALEDRFGMTPIARARLGLVANTAQLTADEVRRRLEAGRNGDKDERRAAIEAEFEAEWEDA